MNVNWLKVAIVFGGACVGSLVTFMIIKGIPSAVILSGGVAGGFFAYYLANKK